jgi:hypothetical protein
MNTNYLPCTICDLIIISNALHTSATWRICKYNTKGYLSDASSIIVDPYIITLEIEKECYVLTALKEDTGYHLIFFTDIDHAEKTIHKIIELVSIPHIIDRDTI